LERFNQSYERSEAMLGHVRLSLVLTVYSRNNFKRLEQLFSLPSRISSPSMFKGLVSPMINC